MIQNFLASPCLTKASFKAGWAQCKMKQMIRRDVVSSVSPEREHFLKWLCKQGARVTDVNEFLLDVGVVGGLGGWRHTHVLV